MKNRINLRDQGNISGCCLYLFQKILGFLATDGPVEPNLLEQLSLEWAYPDFAGFGSSSLEGDNGAGRPSRRIGRKQSRRQRRWKGGRERIYFETSQAFLAICHGVQPEES